MEPINVLAAAAKAKEPYQNSVIAAVNDHVIRMSVMTEPFFWHHHPNSDEFFQVIEGIVAIDLPDETVTLRAGDVLTVPTGTAHRTRPVGARSVNLTCERHDAVTVRLAEPEQKR